MVDDVLFADLAVGGGWAGTVKTSAVTAQTDVRAVLHEVIGRTAADAAVVLLIVETGFTRRQRQAEFIADAALRMTSFARLQIYKYM